MTAPPSVALWHPFTARAIGWAGDDALVALHSRPHVRALRDLAEAGAAQPRVEYLTDRVRPRQRTDDRLEWRFWPRSRRWQRGSGRFRHEWSRAALRAARQDPAAVTIVNTSGHGGPFARRLAATLQDQGRPVVAMIGGFHASLDGPQLDHYRRAAAVAVHTDDLQRRLVDAGIDAGRVVVVPLGVDTGRFRPPVATAPRPPVLLFVGRLLPWKGIDRLIRAAAEVRRTHPDLLVRIVGPPADPAHHDELRALVDDLALGGTVRFEGPLDPDELVPAYQEAAALVLPSEDEGFGMVVPEAMACATPVVALDRPGGPSEIVTDGADGLLVAEGDLGRALADLLADPDRTARLGAAARAKVESQLSQAVTTAAFADLVARAQRA